MQEILGLLSRVLAEFRYPTHQIRFHTLSALNCLTFNRSEMYDD